MTSNLAQEERFAPRDGADETVRREQEQELLQALSGHFRPEFSTAWTRWCASMPWTGG